MQIWLGHKAEGEGAGAKLISSVMQDNKSFLHISSWANGNVQLYGATLIAADCAHNSANGLPAEDCVAFRAPTNQSLIPAIL